jgi:transcription termination factor Rho
MPGDDFFDSFFSPLERSWNRMFQEKDGYRIMRGAEDGSYIATFNTIGISPNDIKVTNVKRGNGVVLRVSGKSTIKEINDEYDANYEIMLSNPNGVQDVQYKVKDGLTIVYIKFNKPKEEIETNAKLLGPDEDTDW